MFDLETPLLLLCCLQVLFILNATRVVSSFNGNLRGSIIVKRTPGSTGQVSWQYIGVVVRQGDTVYLSGFATCPYTQFLPVDNFSPLPNAWSNSTMTCPFAFTSPLGSSTGGINATLLGEISTNKNFQIQANVTYNTFGGAPDVSNTLNFQFDTATSQSGAGVWTGVGLIQACFYDGVLTAVPLNEPVDLYAVCVHCSPQSTK